MGIARQIQSRAAPARTSLRSAGTLQRKCSCGGHAVGGECGKCSKSKSELRREPNGTATAPEVPGIVHDVLRSPGSPLDAATRASMEPRFGRDFSRVRVHSDAAAAASARSVGAAAYTFSNHIVLGDGALAGASRGSQLMAHELAHTLQQDGAALALPTSVSDPNSESEREADALAARVVEGGAGDGAVAIGGAVQPVASPTAASSQLMRVPVGGGRTQSQTNPTTNPGANPASPSAARPAPRTFNAGPPRGPNPADCMTATCAALGRGPPAANDAEALKRVNDWESRSLDCIRTGAAASNASHAAGIVANEESEIPAKAAGLRGGLQSLGSSAGRYRDLQNMLSGDCTRKAREVQIEFHYNVVFSNPPGAPVWGQGAADWDSVEGALSALPAQATWANPQMITFSRTACHPSNLNAQGQCVGSGGASGVSTFIGGEAHPNIGGVEIFDAGLSPTPFSRSARLKLSGTQQTIRHEVGHLIDAQLPQAEMARFFRDIVGWEDFSWSWVTAATSPHANWRAERERLRLQLGFTEAQLTTWLGSLQPGQPVTVGPLTYTRETTGMYLTARDPSRIPTGVAFEYGRTSRGEYFAELYALAVSRPAFLYDAIPSAQSEWLKRVVFGTPATGAEWASRLAVRSGITVTAIERLLRTYTWEQAQTILDAFYATQTPGRGTPT